MTERFGGQSAFIASKTMGHVRSSKQMRHVSEINETILNKDAIGSVCFDRKKNRECFGQKLKWSQVIECAGRTITCGPGWPQKKNSKDAKSDEPTRNTFEWLLEAIANCSTEFESSRIETRRDIVFTTAAGTDRYKASFETMATKVVSGR